MAKEEGLLAVYAGLSATLAGVLPFYSIKLAAYDMLRKRATLQAASGSSTGSGSKGSKRKAIESSDAVSLPVPTVAAIGAGSGVLAATSCFPLEVVRRRQMAGELVGLNPLAALIALVRSDGASVLIKGSGLNCVKVAVGNSLGFVLYELAKDVLLVDGRSPPWKRAEG